jgi:predicted phosphoadenosine phosphosulfate sulfurtransferase
MRVKDDFISRGFFKVGNGTCTRFCEDIWLGKVSLAQQYPSLYNILHHKNVTIAHVLAQNPMNISFRQVLNGNKWTSWLQLCRRLMTVNLNEEKDLF